MKVTNMTQAAQRAIQRAEGTTGGTFLLVGYNGEAIIAGDKIRKSMPHERVDVMPGDKLHDVETRLAVAVIKLRKVLPQAVRQWKSPAGPPRPTRAHGWSKKGSAGGTKK